MTLKELANNRIREIRTELILLKLNAAQIEEKNYNYEFTVSSAQDKLKVQVYFGKKGVKILIQGSQDSLLYKELYPIIFDQQLFDFATRNEDEPEEYIGSDESGKGDVFGPLVVGAFFVNKDSKDSLVKLGVKDSKELSEVQINKIAQNLRKNFSDDYEIISINPDKYNLLYDKFRNLNSVLTWAHSKAINNLLKRKNCTEVISDKFSNQALTLDLNMNSQKVNLLQIPKAEKYLGVAAASIMARYVFNFWFLNKKPHGITLPKGASEEVNSALKIFHEKGDSFELNKFAKLHFKNIRKII